MEEQYKTPEKVQWALPSMVCGIVGIPTSCVPFAGLILGIVAVVFYAKANKLLAESGGKLEGKGMATAGLVCGIIAMVFGFINLLSWLINGMILAGLFSALKGMH